MCVHMYSVSADTCDEFWSINSGVENIGKSILAVIHFYHAFRSIHSVCSYTLYSCGEHDLYACFCSLYVYRVFKRMAHSLTKNCEYQKLLAKHSSFRINTYTRARTHTMGSCTDEHYDWSFQFSTRSMLLTKVYQKVELGFEVCFPFVGRFTS